MRIWPAEAMAQSRRVRFTISMMVRTPAPSGPTRSAQAAWNSTSDEALDLLPSLSFSRWNRSVFWLPSGRWRGIR